MMAVFAWKPADENFLAPGEKAIEATRSEAVHGVIRENFLWSRKVIITRKNVARSIEIC